MIWALIPAPIKRALAWAVAGLVTVLAIFGLAKRDARRGAALDAAQDYKTTRERIDHANDGIDSNDSDKLREWLRRRGQQ
jgi:hypothetical protein